MKKKILAGFASFTLATALVIAPSIVGGGSDDISSANAATSTLTWNCFNAAKDRIKNNTCSSVQNIQYGKNSMYIGAKVPKGSKSPSLIIANQVYYGGADGVAKEYLWYSSNGTRYK
jgi:hypothetical protein